MKVGDKVRLIKGNPLGKVGVIKSVLLMTRPVTITSNELKEAKPEECFGCEAEDGIQFSGFADELELVK